MTTSYFDHVLSGYFHAAMPDQRNAMYAAQQQASPALLAAWNQIQNRSMQGIRMPAKCSYCELSVEGSVCRNCGARRSA